MINEKTGTLLIAISGIFVLLGFFIVDPISQDLNYHNFSDLRSFISIPNTLNVLSNMPFLIVGIWGLVVLHREGKISPNIINSNRLAYIFLFFGAASVGVGSSYYHFWPTNETLVWDRIPMTITFMALYSIIISEFVSEKLGEKCLVPLIFLGLCSVLYWWFTESRGAGDLRYYAVVQFFPILTIPLMLIFFKSKYNYVWGYWLLLITYVAAKIFETFDYQIHNYFGMISGHTIKHVLPAVGLYVLIYTYKKRSAILRD